MKNSETETILRPVGYIRSSIKERYEAPHQGVLSSGDESFIELLAGNNFEQALDGLAEFERIWVIYSFHLNTTWKPMVKPPRNMGKKVGVFATRSPHRPNGMGLSCVKLVSVQGLRIYITESDILDGSPVYDIKPYLPYSDSFPDSATGWAGRRDEKYYSIIIDEQARQQAEIIRIKEGPNLLNYAKVQLRVNASDTGRKRIELRTAPDVYSLSYRSRSIVYHVDEEKGEVRVLSIV